MYDPTIDKELIIINRFGLIKFNEHHNRPYDAYDNYGNLFEIKTTSVHRKKFNLSNHLNINHVHKWRNTNWVMGYWSDDKHQFDKIYLILKENMKLFLDELESYFNEITEITNKILNELYPIDEHDYQIILKIMQQAKIIGNVKQLHSNYVKANGILIETKYDLMREMQKR